MTLSIFSEGKEYISASRASEKIGYASDYIGQLCRAGKIPSKLIGRTWYVDYASLENHKKNKQLFKRDKAKKFASKSLSEKSQVLKDSSSLGQLSFSSGDRGARSIKDSVFTYESDYRSRLPEIKGKSKLLKAGPTWRFVKESAVVALGLILALTLGLGHMGQSLPEALSSLERETIKLSNHGFQNIALIPSDYSEKEFQNLSAIGFASDALDFLTSGFKNLKSIALKNIYFGIDDPQLTKNISEPNSKGEENKTPIISAPVPTPEFVAAVHTTAPVLNVDVIKNDLRAELENYIRVQVGRASSPVTIYSSSPVINQTILREEIVTRDTRPAITRESDSISSRIAAILNGGTLTGTHLVNPVIDNPIFGDITVTSCTGCGGGGSFNYPFLTLATGEQATSTTMLFGNGLISTASSTLSAVTLSTLLATEATSSSLYVSGLASSTNLRANSAVFGNITVGSCTGCSGGGSAVWSDLTDPSTSLSLAHGANTTAFTFDSVTTGNAFSLSSSGLTSGTLLQLTSTSTAAVFNGNRVLDIRTAGANSNASQTTYGALIENSHTGTTNTNIALSASSSFASTLNVGVLAAATVPTGQHGKAIAGWFKEGKVLIGGSVGGAVSSAGLDVNTGTTNLVGGMASSSIANNFDVTLFSLTAGHNYYASHNQISDNSFSSTLSGAHVGVLGKVRKVSGNTAIPSGVAFDADIDAAGGAITTGYGYRSTATVGGSGSITDYYGFYAKDPTVSGTLTNRYSFISESSAGRAGIGTTTPIARLAVNPVAGDANQFFVGSSTATAFSSSFIIKDSGFVGIGLANPTALLHVSGLASTTNLYSNSATFGDITVGACTGCGVGGGGTFAWPFTKQADNSQATSTLLSLFGGIFTNASSTLASTTLTTLLANSATTSSLYVSGRASTTELRSNTGFLGGLGIGTTTLFAKLSLESLAGDPINQFYIGSSSATALNPSFIIKDWGGVGIGTSTPNSILTLAHTSATLGNASFGEGVQSSRRGFATGYNVSSSADSLISATGQGSFAFGQMTLGLGIIKSSAAGTFAGGRTLTVSGTSSIISSGSGSFAMGFAGGNAGIGTITSSGSGSFAMGNLSAVTGTKNITSSNSGSFAMGNVSNGDITATGAGSFAFGDNINSTATNAISFGSGFTNSLASTFQVGFSSTTAPALTVNATSTGLGTTTPFAKLAINAIAGETNQFFVGSSTATVFNTSLIIRDSGFVGIGTPNPTSQFTTTGGVRLWGLANGDGTAYLCTTLTTGIVSTSTTGCNPSSLRYKDNVEDLSYGLTDLMNLRPVAFDYKTDLLVTGHQVGFIAEEMYEVIPEVVGLKNGAPDNIDYGKLTSVIVKAVKELYTEFNDLKSTVLAFAERIVSREIVAVEKFCIGETCINEEQLIQILQHSGAAAPVVSSPTPSPTPSPAPTPSPSPAPTPTPVSEDDPGVTPEPIVEDSALEPVVEEEEIEESVIESTPEHTPLPEPEPAEEVPAQEVVE